MAYLEIDINSNIEKVIDETSIFFYQEIPYAVALTINSTLKDVRRRIVDVTWAKAFNVKNKAFPGRLFRTRFVSVGGPGSQLRAFRDGESAWMIGGVYDSLGREYLGDHAEGGTKRSRRGGGTVAIPKDPAAVRTATGRVAKANKPLNITKKRGVFMVKRGGSPHLILKRTRGHVEPIYYFKDSAKIKKSFRFYEDGVDTIHRVFPGHFTNAFNQATWRSKYKASG